MGNNQTEIMNVKNADSPEALLAAVLTNAFFTNLLVMEKVGLNLQDPAIPLRAKQEVFAIHASFYKSTAAGLEAKSNE